LDRALEQCPKSVGQNSEAIKASVMGALSQADLFLLKLCMATVDEFDQKIAAIDSQIAVYVDEAVVERLCSVPGVGVIGAATVVAELGDVSRFVDEKAVSSYVGLCRFCIRVDGSVAMVI
jgi:transposase